MRVLLVNGYPPDSKHGCALYKTFKQELHTTLKELEKNEVMNIELVERRYSELQDYLYEPNSEFAEPTAIASFDHIDFVVVDGDHRILPWSPVCQQLALLTKMCMVAGKCYYGSSIGASLIAYVTATGGDFRPILNNNGLGEAFKSMNLVKAPAQKENGNRNGVILDTKSGDFFSFEHGRNEWVPIGNTGMNLHASNNLKPYGTRPNSARAGSRPCHVKLEGGLCLAKRGEARCCVRLECARNTIMLQLPNREFIVQCKSQFNIDEVIACTSSNRYRVLADSNRGPMFIEFGNCVGTHFVLSRTYPESCVLLREFLLSKYKTMKEYECDDSGYLNALRGTFRDRRSLAKAKASSRCKHIESLGVKAVFRQVATARGRLGDDKSNQSPQVSVWKSMPSSPRRCRPVSAAPVRSSSLVSSYTPRQVQTARATYSITSEMSIIQSPKNSLARVDSSICPKNEVTSKQKLLIPPDCNVSNQKEPNECKKHRSMKEAFGSKTLNAKPQKPKESRRRVRVVQKTERTKPYCAVKRFEQLRDQEVQAGKATYYSIVDDGPYMSKLERATMEEQQGKEKWVGGPFQTTIGKATTSIKSEAGIFARGEYSEKHTPYYILQRSHLDKSLPSNDKVNERKSRTPQSSTRLR